MIQIIALSMLLFSTMWAQAPAVSQPGSSRLEGEWIVEVIDNIPVMPDSRVTLNVRDNTVTGMGSCNQYRGPITVTGDNVITVGELLKTMKACDGPRMSQESDFFATLRDVVRYELRPKEKLVLSTASGKTIVAARAPGSHAR